MTTEQNILCSDFRSRR